MTNLLLRGMLAGLLAGLLAFGFARFYGEPQVDRAISFESRMSQMGHPTGEAHKTELVSRDVQAGLGLFIGVVVYGTAIGGLFSLVFAFVCGRISGLSPRATAALLALAGFLAIVAAPGLKYPPNPPSVGEPGTIGERTALYFSMMAISLAAVVLAIDVLRRARHRLDPWNAAILAGAVFVFVIAAAQSLLPDIDEVPEHFSAVVLWRFRIAAFGVQAVLWTILGLGFGFAVEKGRNWSAASQRPATRHAPG